MKDKKVIFGVTGIIIIVFALIILTILVILNKDEKNKHQKNDPTPTPTEEMPTPTPTTVEGKLQALVGDDKKVKDYKQQPDGTYHVYVKQKNTSSHATGYYIVDLENETVSYRSEIKITVSQTEDSSGSSED